MNSIKTMENLAEKDFSKIGGKARNLYILLKNKSPVPPFYVITTQFYQNYIEKNNISKKIKQIMKTIDFKDKKSVSNASKQIKELFVRSDISKEDLKSLLLSYEAFKKEKDAEYVAVRSSAIGEDDLKASFAGQMDSFLFVPDAQNYIDSIKRCFLVKHLV